MFPNPFFCAVLLPIALTSLLIEPGAGRGSSWRRPPLAARLGRLFRL